MTTTETPAAAPVVDGWRLAVGTLTALPVTPPTRINRAVAGRAMTLAPLAALVPAAGAVAVAAVARAVGLQAALVAVLALAASVLITRALHLDGLADTADGLAAAYDRVRALQVMRSGDSGPAGISAVMLVLLVQAAALTQLLGHPGALGLVAVGCGLVLGRLALPLLCLRGIPAARPEGLGATVAGSVPRPIAALAAGGLWAVAAVVLAAAGVSGPRAVAAGASGVLLVGLTVGLLAVRSCRRLGGVTGDVLGAGVELASAAAWIALCASL